MSQLANSEQRTNRKFCVKLIKRASETLQMLQALYEDEVLSRPKAFEWYNRFKNKSESLEDCEHRGHQSGRHKNKS